MAFPFVFQEDFEAGTKGGFDTETDTGSQLDFAHISKLAQSPGNLAPFRGAYCARWRLGANSTDAMLVEGDCNIADGATSYFRWYIFFANDFAFTADDVVTIFRLEQDDGTDEVTIGLNLTAATNSMVIGAGDGSAAATFGTTEITRNEWHCVEVEVKCSTGDAGTVKVWLDGVQQGATLTDQDHGGAIGLAVLGFQDRLDTTTGTVLMDQFVQDDARIYPIVDRFPRQVLLTKSGHVALGQGVIENISLLSGAATDNVLAMYDTAEANTNDATKIGVELKNVTNSDIVDPAGMPVAFRRGCFVNLTGTNPRALVNIGYASGYGSLGALRNFGQRYRRRPSEIF